MHFDWNSCHSMWKFKSFTWLCTDFAFLHASVNKDANKYHVYPFPHYKKYIAVDLLKYLCKSLVKLHSVQFSSVQSLSRVQLFATQWTAACQAFLSLTNSRSPPKPLCRWRHPTISSSVIPLSSCPQSFPALGCFQMSQLSASGGQSIGVSTSTSVPPMNTQDWSPLGWTVWISLHSKGLSRVFSNTTLWKWN